MSLVNQEKLNYFARQLYDKIKNTFLSKEDGIKGVILGQDWELVNSVIANNPITLPSIDTFEEIYIETQSNDATIVHQVSLNKDSLLFESTNTTHREILIDSLLDVQTYVTYNIADNTITLSSYEGTDVDNTSTTITTKVYVKKMSEVNGTISANRIIYDNSTSNMIANNIQDAVDELKNTIDNKEIIATKLNIDEINANNGLTGLKLAGFTVTDTSLYNQKESLASNDVGCYIGTDGIAYSGTERHFKVNSSGDVVSDAIYSSDGVQLLCHNTSFTSNPNGNVVLAYGNANETNLYGNEIRLIPSPDETDYDYRILIQKGLIAPYLDSTYNLGNATHKWSKIYCDELICTTVTSENGGSSSGGVSSGDTVSNITITGQNNFLKDGNLYLGNAGSIIETYYINSDGNAKFNLCNIVDLNVTGSATLPTLSKVTITGENNYLKDGKLYLGTSSFNYYLNGDGNGSFNLCNIVDLNVTGSATLPTLSKVTITGENNYLKDGKLYLGTSSFNYYINSDGNGSFVNLYYNTLTQNSSKRFKENIDYKDNTYWHDKLMGIKPCTFNYKNKDGERIGVIAEDLYETFPELVQKDSDGLVSSVSYVDMIVPLVSEVQRLNKEINELKSLIG